MYLLLSINHIAWKSVTSLVKVSPVRVKYFCLFLIFFSNTIQVLSSVVIPHFYGNKFNVTLFTATSADAVFLLRTFVRQANTVSLFSHVIFVTFSSPVAGQSTQLGALYCHCVVACHTRYPNDQFIKIYTFANLLGSVSLWDHVMFTQNSISNVLTILSYLHEA